MQDECSQFFRMAGVDLQAAGEDWKSSMDEYMCHTCKYQRCSVSTTDDLCLRVRVLAVGFLRSVTASQPLFPFSCIFLLPINCESSRRQEWRRVRRNECGTGDLVWCGCLIWFFCFLLMSIHSFSLLYSPSSLLSNVIDLCGCLLIVFPFPLSLFLMFFFPLFTVLFL